ncbi:hypothetical protein [Streptomyces sp. NPDC057748]|uniref:hypothetical protein n=1 Tax=unclassified Streptomyces TaxID=2593676 RepID=UPI003689FCCE
MRLTHLLGEHGFEAAGVPIVGSTRIDIMLVEPDGMLTKVNGWARRSPLPRPRAC